MSPAVTVVVMVAAFLGLVGLDVWLALDGRSENTDSARLRAMGKAWPASRLLLAFGMGLLAGHLYW